MGVSGLRKEMKSIAQASETAGLPLGGVQQMQVTQQKLQLQRAFLSAGLGLIEGMQMLKLV